ncbi:MAG: TraB/GumN family protein [Colwellia sp.]
MNKLTITAIVFLLFSGSNFQAQAKSSVWKITKNNDHIYLAGTVHILPPSEFPLPQEFEQAYKQADELVFETKLPDESDIAFQTKMMQALTYSGDKKLSDVITKQTLSDLSTYATELGADIMMFDKFKPGLLLTFLTMMEAQRAGISGEGVDAYFSKLALKDGKALSYLESVDFQMNMMAQMGVGYEDTFLQQNMEDFENFADLLYSLIKAWRLGDTQALNRLAVEPMKKDPQSMKLILNDRNTNWIPHIEKMFQDDNKELVMVGAAHIVGEKGLIKLLENKGYKVEQLSK